MVASAITKASTTIIGEADRAGFCSPFFLLSCVLPLTSSTPCLRIRLRLLIRVQLIGERLPVVIAHHKAGGLFLDRPGRSGGYAESPRETPELWIARFPVSGSPMEWKPIDTVPFDQDVEIAISDNTGVHAFARPYRLTRDGWIDTKDMQRLYWIPPTHWRDLSR